MKGEAYNDGRVIKSLLGNGKSAGTKLSDGEKHRTEQFLQPTRFLGS